MHFVDTNVLVYARDDAEPWKRDRAREVMRRLWRTRQGRVSHQVLIEFYNTVTRKLSPGLPRDEAISDVRELLVWEPVAPDSALFERAWQVEDRYRLSWWDSLIAAAALIQDCQILHTEDLQDGMEIDGLRVVNPFGPAFDFRLLE